MPDNTREDIKDKQCRLLVEGVRDYAMILLDVQGRITVWNAGAEHILGWAEAETLGQAVDMIFTPEDRANGLPSAEIARAAGEGGAMNLRWHLRKDGTRFWADGILEALRGEAGALIGFAKVLRDATAQKRDAEQTHEAGGRLEAVLESLTDAFFSLDRDWRITYVNAQAERFLSRTRRQMLGRGFWEEFPDAVGTTFDRQYRRAVAEQTPVTFEEFYPPLSAWFELRAYPSSEGLSLYCRDITEARQVREALAESEARFRTLYETMPQGVVYQDAAGVIVAANPAAQRLLGLSLGEITGRVSADTRWRAVREDGTDLPGEDHPPMCVLRTGRPALDAILGIFNPILGETRWLRVNAIPQFSPGADRPYQVHSTFEDVTERRRAEAERSRAEEELREAHRQTAGILERIADAFFALDHDWRFTYVNNGALSLWGRTRGEMLGKNVWEEFPEAVGSTFDKQFHRAIAEQTPVTFEEFYPPLSAWLDVRCYPSPDGLSVYFQNVNERKALEAEQARLSDANRLLLESTSEGIYGIDAAGRLTFVNQAGARMLGFTLGEMLGREGHSLLHHTRPDGRPYPAEECPIYQVLQTGEGVRVEDDVFWRKDGTAFPVSFSAAPIQEGDLVTGAVVTFDDIAGRKALEAERERLLAASQARAEREALVNRIGSAIRATTDPERIQEEAARLLGEALGVDRCYFSAYDHEGDAVRIGRDWHRADLPSVAGEYGLTDYQEYVDVLYAQGTAVIPDVEDPSLAPVVARTLARFGLRAFLAVPLLDGGRFVAAVAAAMSDGPRVWTPDEVSLMETVLTQTRTASETARVRQRERNIAGQLQAALQPPLPGVMRGLDLAKYYEAALDEAGVGGDFYDVFPIEKGCTALIVGDLSGKGLAAAAQVSTVRNMLRAYLYSKPTLGEAVSELNRIIAQNGLLSGFATLFVGCYDSGMRTLTYVNCGQEPGLIRRAATGVVEELGPTGAILGMTEDSNFEEKIVSLLPGDALALFTDGLTEAGPNRRELLGVEGVTALLAGRETIGEDAEALMVRLIEGVDDYARGGVRDDVCLLVGVA